MTRDGDGPDDRGPGPDPSDSRPTVDERGGPAPATTPARPSARHDHLDVAVRSVFDPPVERFVAGDELGRGGMGRVVEAHDLALDRPVAVKHLLERSPELVARFEREVRITARLQHPGIVAILDVGRDDQGLPYYVMRKIDGSPLSDRVGTSAVRERLALVPAILGAVDAAAYAHAQGVVHRDIKPWNILLGPFGETLLIDWGIARTLDAEPDPAPADAAPTDAAPPEDADGDPHARGRSGPATGPSPDPQLTKMGAAVGTPGFMAPEQARGEPVDRRADVYSLGATLYFVLTGELPFGSSGATEAITEVAAGRGPDLTKLPPEVPAELAAITGQALAIEPRDRYADAGELAADLRRFLAGKLVAAHDYTPAERIGRWIRRHRIAVGVATTAAIAVGVVIAVAFARIVDERDQATSARALAEDRTEEMVVERARSLVTADPTSAVALLRGLPRASSRWAEARGIVRAAVTSGVDRGIVAHASGALAVAIAADGRVATHGMDRKISIYDPARHAIVATLDTQATVSDLVWRDEHRLLSVDRRVDNIQVHIHDLHTGETELVLDHAAGVALAAGRAALISPDGAPVFLPGNPAVPAWFTYATRVASSRDRLVAIGPTGILVVDHDGSIRSRRVELPANLHTVELSTDGRRVAAASYAEIFEWRLEDTQPPRRITWPGRSGLRLFYVGDTLHVWDPTGLRGIVSLATATPDPRWLSHDDNVLIARCRDTVFVSTPGGRIVFLDEAGSFELPRRHIGVRAVACDDDRRRLYLGTSQGELIAIDLSAVLPQRYAARRGTGLLAVSPRNVVLADDNPQHGISVRTVSPISMIDLATGKRVALTTMTDPSGALGDDGVMVWSRPDGRWAAFDRAGVAVKGADAPILSSALGPSISADGLSLFYTLETGELYEVSLDGPSPPRLLHRLGSIVVRGERKSMVITMMSQPEGLYLAEVHDTAGHYRSWWIERDGPHEILPGALPILSFAIKPDGTWWFTDLKMELWRKRPGGVPVRVPIGEVTAIKVVGDQVWASLRRRVVELADDGTAMRALTVPGDRRDWGWTRDELIVTTVEGMETVDVVSGSRRILRSTRAIVQRVATVDGRSFAALVRNKDAEEILVWRDPVPEDPAALPAYLDHITNARLSIGSDALRWD